MPAQIVASCYDPDTLISSAGLACVKQLIAWPPTQQRVLDAGAAGAIVRALSHPSVYCRSAACFIITFVDGNSDLLQRLLDAKIIPALMKVAREGPTSEAEVLDDPKHGIFAYDPSQCLDPAFRGFSELAMQPGLSACASLVMLMQVQGSIARAVTPEASRPLCHVECPFRPSGLPRDESSS